MLKRSLLIAVAIVLAYNACLHVSAFRKLFSVQGQWQENIITAQRYLLEDRSPQAVIVGSSMSAALPESALKPDIGSLAFHGGSIFTGLEVVEAKEALPRAVIIEDNVLFKESDPALLQNVLSPGFRPLRSRIVALQQQWQPVNFLAGKLSQRAIEKICSIKYRLRRFAQKDEGSTPATGTNLFNTMLAIARERHNEPLAPDALAQQCELLRQHVERLRSRGVECVFLEMPVDASLVDSPRCAAIRAQALQAFPPGKFPWITPEKGHNYVTSDGQHLRGEEAEAFARYLRSRLSQMGLLDPKVQRSASNRL